jgi:hypothetical protein
MEKNNLETCWNYCLNGKITEAQKLVLLKSVLDDDSFQAIKQNREQINREFEVNLPNILVGVKC